MIWRRKPFWLLMLVLASLLLVTLAVAGGETLPRSLVSSGGGLLPHTELNLRTALGQPVGGEVANGLTLCSGFLCGSQVYSVYLPAVLRE